MVLDALFGVVLSNQTVVLCQQSGALLRAVQATWTHSASHHITPHHTASHHTTSHYITPHHITLHHTTSHHISSHSEHHTTSYLTSHYITPHYRPYYITSHNITSFHTLLTTCKAVMQFIPCKHTHVHTPSLPPADMSTMDHICMYSTLTFSRRAFSSCSVESWEASSSRSLKDCCSRARHLTGGRDGVTHQTGVGGWGPHIRQEEGMGSHISACRSQDSQTHSPFLHLLCSADSLLLVSESEGVQRCMSAQWR